MSIRASSRNGWLAATAACLVLGCGARALVEPADDDPDPVGQGGGGRGGSAGESTPAGAGARAASAAAGRPGGDDELVEIISDSCGDPFRRSDDRERECPYIYRGVCYPSGVCACSSACTGDAQCVIDGFLEPDEPQRVRCISP